MPTFIRKSVLITVAILVSSLALCAAEAIVTRNANLRNDPSSKHVPLRQLQADDEVELISSEPTNGYYNVKTDDGSNGWIWGKTLRILPPATARSPPTPFPPS